MGFIIELVLTIILVPFSFLIITNVIAFVVSYYLTSKFGVKIKLTTLGWFIIKGTCVRFPKDTSLNVGQLRLESGISQLLKLFLSQHRKDAVVKLKATSIGLTSCNFRLFVETLLVDHNENYTTITISNGNVVSRSQLTEQNTESSQRVIALSKLVIVIDRKLKERSFHFSGDVFLQWSPSFHLELFDLYEEWMGLMQLIKNSKSNLSEPNIKPTSDSWSLLNLKMSGNVSIGSLLSNSGQTIAFKTAAISLVMPTKSRMIIKSDAIAMHCDEHRILWVENVDIRLVPESEGSAIVDRAALGIKLETVKNRALLLSFSTVSVLFPFKYNFADTFNQRFITITKWLRLLHRKKSLNDSLPNVALDLSVKVQSFIMRIEDDPFEIKLRNNYELQDEEHIESEKRKQVFDSKIEELRRTSFLPDAKIEELKVALQRKDADIYINRHKKQYSCPDAENPRLYLFTVKSEGIHVQAVADLSYTGYDKLIHILSHRLDTVSPLSEDVRFSTIWCRYVYARIDNLICSLRDFNKPFMDIDNLIVSGLLMGAEQEATSRAKRVAFVDIGPGMESIPIERTMPSLKFFHDLNLDVKKWHYTHGACWEPVLSQLSLSFELISRPSLDPSPTLPWWDRMRFLFHGPLYVKSDNISLFFHGSLNPYNKTELIEIYFGKVFIQWLTGQIKVHSDLDLKVHTASKYDECRIIHIPNCDAQIYLEWVCLGSQYDHHAVMPCAADKVLVPEFSCNPVHDSYRAFRSQNLNVKVTLESKLVLSGDIPSVLMYSSSIRWFENQKQIFSGITRLTRRGVLFQNTKKRKLGFSRIFKKIRVAVCLPKVKAVYWSSFNKTYGCEIIGGPFSHSGEHTLSLIPYDDELSRRPRPMWDMTYMNSELSSVEIVLLNNRIPSSADETIDVESSRSFLLNIKLVSYNRENKEKTLTSSANNPDSPPTHRLIIHDLKGAWTKPNKDVVFALFDLFMRAQQLKRNLSTEALKMFKVEKGHTLHSGTSPIRHRTSTTSPASTISKGHAASMLQKLIMESEINPNPVYTEDVESELSNDEPKLKGVIACQDDDVIQRNWLIELINSQVMLRGCETSGYAIASAAKTQIWQKIHRPVWKERTLYSKQSWVGSVECMQYYATVDAKIDSDIVWLTVDNIQEKSSSTIADLPDLVGSSQSVGGVVTEIISPEDGMRSPSGSISNVQLQRIISRCGCQFYFAGFSDDVDEDLIAEVPPLPGESDVLVLEPWDNEVAVDSFTLMYHELDVSTNSQQFEMIIDLVNNLLLYVEPHRKEAAERYQRMRFQMFLNPNEDQRLPIAKLQDELRKLITDEKNREKEIYMIQQELSIRQSPEEEEALRRELNAIEEESDRCKANVNRYNDDLQMMISCYKETLITADKTRERQEATAGGNFVASVVKRIDVCFRQASWRLTDCDGQLGLADLVLRNFLYNKVAKNDDSVEHTLELGYICVLNLLPNQIYNTVLQPTELKPNIPLDRHRALRIFCRERAPVAGICIKEHFEVNVIPLTIGVTHAFFKQMLKFFFPGPAVEEQKPPRKRGYMRKAQTESEIIVPSSSSTASSSTTSSTEKSRESKDGNKKALPSADVDKMRERAQKNQTFVYIKIPEVPIRVSYKGNKQKNIEDINNFCLIMPTIEYHNQTWTWLDVLMAIKNESRTRLLSQAVKQKLHIRPSFFSGSQQQNVNEDTIVPPPQVNQDEEEERKTRLLLGNFALPSTQQPKAHKLGLSFLKRK